MLRKLLSYIIIILIWGGFGYYYFSLYITNRPAPEDTTQENGGEQEGEIPIAQLADSDRSIRPDMLCLDSSALVDAPWTFPAIHEGIQGLNINTVRIPGGDPAAYWDWQTGIVAPNETRSEPVNKENNLERYLEGIKATGTTPIIVLNMLTADLQNQLTMLQTIEENGVPVRYIELGHGLYQGGLQSNYGQAFPTGSDYTAVAEEWITAIRERFPEVSIAAVAAPEGIERGRRIGDWNEAVYALADSQDLAVSLYPFPNQGLDSGQKLQESMVPTVFGLPFQTWRQYSAGDQSPLASLPEDVPIWLTAYNIPDEAEGDVQIAERYGQVMFVLIQSLIFLGDERVEFICPHQLMGPRPWAAFLRRNERFDLMATGRAVRILGHAMSGMTTARSVEFTNIPAPRGTNIPYPTLLGWHFEDDNGRQTALILNLTQSRLEVNIGELPTDFPQQFQQTVGDPTRRTRNNDGVEIVTGNIIDENYLIFLPYSATLFFSE